jgi:hypothetical protein
MYTAIPPRVLAKPGNPYADGSRDHRCDDNGQDRRREEKTNEHKGQLVSLHMKRVKNAGYG